MCAIEDPSVEEIRQFDKIISELGAEKKFTNFELNLHDSYFWYKLVYAAALCAGRSDESGAAKGRASRSCRRLMVVGSGHIEFHSQ